MKKTVIIMISMMLLFIPILVGFEQTKANGGVLLVYDKKALEAITQLRTTEYVKNIVVLPTESYEMDEVVPMINRISRIHPSILKKAADQGIKLKLFEGPLTNQPGYTELKGVKPRGYKQLTWDQIPGAGGSKMALAKIGHSHKGESHGSVNLELHELAHSIDQHVFHSLRYEKRFRDIWHEEASLLFPNQPYFIDHAEEYFAEVFAMFYLNGRTKLEIVQKAPKTYEYMKELEQRKETDLQLAYTFR
ncbi:anthrax toxin lethal factor-related metalloendopeptidase [Bacillus sp. AK128]